MSVVTSKRQIIAAAARRTAGLLQEASAATDQLSTDLKAPVETDAKAAHRRAYRMGAPSKITPDPKVRAFVESRFDTLTFGEISKAVAETFPPKHRVSRSSIHRWWQKSPPREARQLAITGFYQLIP